MYAVKRDHAETTGLESQRRIRLVPTALVGRAEEEADSAADSAVINLLADALETIAATTTDTRTRELAENALAEYQGR
jgi:hypothetical protein